MMFYLGAMGWVVKKFAWIFFKSMKVSGAEAVIAAASPFIGQGESACMVKPFVDFMTKSEVSRGLPISARLARYLAELIARFSLTSAAPSRHDLWFLNHLRICPRWLHCPRRPRRVPHYRLGHVYPGLYRHFQNCRP